jgi:hypothetical protein
MRRNMIRRAAICAGAAGALLVGFTMANPALAIAS